MRRLSKATHLHGSDGNDVVRRGNEAVHAPVPIDLYSRLLDQLHVLLVLFNVRLGRQKLAAFRRCGRYHGEGCRSDDSADVVAVGILGGVSSIRARLTNALTGLVVLSL